MSNITPDAALAQRLQKAIAIRDEAKNIDIRLKAELDIAKRQADEALKEVQELFEVSSLTELQKLTQAEYQKNLDAVEKFEKDVREYVENVNKSKNLIKSDV